MKSREATPTTATEKSPVLKDDSRRKSGSRIGAWHPGGGLNHTGCRRAAPDGSSPRIAAEEIGIDGAFVRVHHFARQLASPFPLLAAIGARTSRIEIGTGVIDMRYENPLYMAEDAAAADLLARRPAAARRQPRLARAGAARRRGVRLRPGRGRDRRRPGASKTALFRAAIAGAGVVRADAGGEPGDTRCSPIQPQSPGLADRIWWGSGTRETAVWAAEQGMNLMSSTLLTEDTRVPFDELQAEQIELFRDAWAKAGHDARAARLGQPQRDADHLRPRPAALRRRDANAGPGRLARRRHQPLRHELHRRARPDRRRAGRGRRRRRPPTPCSSTVPNQLGVDYNAALLADDRRATSRPRSAGARGRTRGGQRDRRSDRPARWPQLRSSDLEHRRDTIAT